MVPMATQSFSSASQGLGIWLEGLEGRAAADVSCSIYLFEFISSPFFFFCFFLKQDKKDLYEPVCNIPIITSPKEEERLIESSMKVTAFPQLSTEKLNAC